MKQYVMACMVPDCINIVYPKLPFCSMHRAAGKMLTILKEIRPLLGRLIEKRSRNDQIKMQLLAFNQSIGALITEAEVQSQ